MDNFEKKEWIKKWALDLGFSSMNVAKANRLDREAERLKEWLNLGYHGSMGYMENHFEKRVDPTQLVPGARSVIIFTFNYFTKKKQLDPEAPKIAMYALGKDYHDIIRKKLNQLKEKIDDKWGETTGRGFVDSAPVLERDWAERAGAGWKGKNTLLIHPKKGSYFFLASLITELELPEDQPIKDYCGTCRKCIDICPTSAILEEGYTMDASKCISYLTIEKRDEIPTEFKGKMDNWMFGCDLCQQVCPWNRFSEEHNEPKLEADEHLLKKNKEEWLSLDQEEFSELFQGSAVKRTKFRGLKRNIEFLSDNNDTS
ncbi:MAG: tRNA epoxyqueuosine(34) reductase QueG [Saprospirales bacterium]|nr:MAG: tRNA epoxyqueuosine(34) reductase QueG [Saprospirales bacterium]